jgi:PhnB protein
MPVNPYINFNGNCRAAVEHYADVFKTEPPGFMTFAEGPANPAMPIPDAAKNLIMHTQIDISGTTVMFSDVFPGMELVQGNNISLTVVSKDRDQITHWFNRLKEHGTVHMELQETFWTGLYGNLRDKYGIEWQFSLDDGRMAG